ncbi:SRPBCC family protein [Pseudochryseolinea flava]|uniref:SRPBCC family protein n=1 Tax=Pseudochryseolinea flava TaxID=2059302 RepID=A0A364Y4E7_9BACT|nr:hypothetical protein [Pseudochryseolinea flava]RAW01820.1 hypothetical protein DQQ10_09255 [Pseudochryseolinea flava]
MKKIAQKYKLLIIGIVVGVAYGMLTRLRFGEDATLASITYLFLVPTILGIVPLIFAGDDQLRSYRNIIFIPWICTATFFVVMVVAGVEGILCLLVLGGPFFILGTLGAFIFRLFLLRDQKRKLKSISLLLLPFLLSPLEEFVESPSAKFEVSSSILINASSNEVWNQIVEVDSINHDEYDRGILNVLGIPRPINATVTHKGVGGERVGNFEGGLRFVERITEFEPNRRVSFSIKVDPASVRHNVFDQHVLNGNYFRFVDATYEIEIVDNHRIKLNLSSQYQLTSKINFYGRFWGDLMLKDFQDRLLVVIRRRSEVNAPLEIQRAVVIR